MVQSVERCAEILNCVAEHPEGMTLGRVAEAMGLKYPTVYNLVMSLTECGLLEKDAENILYPGRQLGVLNACRLRSAYIRQLKRMASDLAGPAAETDGIGSCGVSAGTHDCLFRHPRPPHGGDRTQRVPGKAVEVRAV